jgi:phage FluMu gp28-like protein
MKSKAPIIRLVKDDDFRNAPQHVREADILAWCEKHLKPVLANLNPFLTHVFGEDFARSGDLTVIAIYEMGRDLVRRTVAQIELRNVPFETQRDILFYTLDRIPKLGGGAMDARGNGQYLAEVAAQKYGEKIVEVMLSQAWYRENSTPFTEAVTGGEVWLPKDEDTVRDLQGLQYVNGIIKVPDDHSTKGADGFDRHGDAAIAYVLAWFASRQNHAEYDYTSGRPNKDLDDNHGRGSARRSSSFTIPSVKGGLW